MLLYNSAKFGTTYVIRNTISITTSTISTVGIDERQQDLLADRQRHLLVVDVALEHFAQRTRLFARPIRW